MICLPIHKPVFYTFFTSVWSTWSFIPAVWTHGFLQHCFCASCCWRNFFENVFYICFVWISNDLGSRTIVAIMFAFVPNFQFSKSEVAVNFISFHLVSQKLTLSEQSVGHVVKAICTLLSHWNVNFSGSYPKKLQLFFNFFI